MYWIEVYFENGKTLRKESDNINETYKVLRRYDEDRKRLRVQSIKAGRDETLTFSENKMDGVCM